MSDHRRRLDWGNGQEMVPAVRQSVFKTRAVGRQMAAYFLDLFRQGKWHLKGFLKSQFRVLTYLVLNFTGLFPEVFSGRPIGTWKQNMTISMFICNSHPCVMSRL